MMSLDQIRQALKHIDLAEIARETGLHYNTVRIFMQHGSNPTWRVIQKMVDYLERK